MSNGILMGNAVGLYSYTVSLTPASTSTVTSTEQSFTVPGVKLSTDNVIAITPPSNTAGVTLSYGRITADNTVAIKFTNPTAGSVTPAAGNYVFTILRASPATGLAD